MKKYPFVLWLLSTVLFLGCESGVKTENGLITMDVSKSYPKKELILQDLFDIEYLPLETTDKFVTSGRIPYIADDLMFFVEYRAGNIHIVDRKGKYIKTINRKGQSGEEYISFSALTFDPLKKEIFINDSSAGKIVVYDLNGNFLRSFKTPQGVYFDQMSNFNSDYLICRGDPFADPGDSDYEAGASNSGYILMSKNDGSFRDIGIIYERYVSPVIVVDTPDGKRYLSVSNDSQIPFKDQWILSEISSDTIYQLSPDYKLRPFIVRTPTISEMDPEVYLFTGVMTDRYYFLQTVEKAYDPATKVGFTTRELLYDTEEESVYEYVVYNDDFTDERPLNLVRQYPNTLLAVNNGEVAYVSKIDAPDLVEAYNDGKLRGPLKDIASKIDEEDNPVLMIAKYKKK